MRSGHIARLTIVAGAALVTGACASPGGVAGISTRPPAPTTEAVAAVPGAPTATIPAPTPPATSMPQVVVSRPPGDDPVQVPPPRLSKFTYTFPVKDCRTTYESRLLVLPKTTIWANRGCAFVAPVGGVIDEVNSRNRWKPSTDRGPDREGRFVSLVGDDGVRYLGGHLDTISPGIRPGTRVTGGQTLGRVGNSGNARSTASNLYFAISWKTGPSLWWVRRGMVEPWDYLDAWRDGNRSLSPAEETRAVMKRTGAAPRCATLCASKSAPTPRPTRTPDRKIPLGG